MSMMVRKVPIEFPDRTRHMRLTLSDALAFKKATTTAERPQGISLLRGDLQEINFSEEEWITLFHIMMKHEDASLTVEQVGELIDVSGFKECGEAFGQLMEAFKGEEPAGPARTDPTPSPA